MRHKIILSITLILGFLTIFVILSDNTKFYEVAVTTDSNADGDATRRAVVHDQATVKSLTGVRRCTSRQRMDYIRQHCPINKPRKAELLVDHARKLAYCWIPKVATSTWKLIMANNTGIGPPIPRDQELNPWLHNNIEKFGLKKRFYDDSLQNYTKLIVVRNPIDRFVSAYKDKARAPIYSFSGKRQPTFGPIQKYALEKFNHSNLSSNEKEDYLPILTEFISYVKHKKSDDTHWRPYSQDCDVCNIDYDYILRVESMGQDCPDFLSQLYPNVDACPTYNIHRSVNLEDRLIFPKYLKELEVIDHREVEYLAKRYEVDMKTFGYAFNTTSLKSSCGLTLEDGSVCC